MRRGEFEDENSVIIQTKRPRAFTPLQSRPPLRLVAYNQRFSVLEEIDICDGNNPLTMGYYASDIYENLLKVEPDCLPEPNYMAEQTDISYKMRAILIDWLINVHMKFKLLGETLHLCVSLIDRYLSKREIQRNYLQLVGVCALMIACKYEEIYPPQVNDFIYIMDKAYTADQLLKMEIDMLGTLQFAVTVPSALRFLERWGKIVALDEKNSFLSKYLAELALVEYHMLRFKPSVIALAAVYLSMKIGKADMGKRSAMIKAGKCTDQEVKACAHELLCLFQSAWSHTLACVREKYSKKEYLEVSKIKIS